MLDLRPTLRATALTAVATLAACTSGGQSPEVPEARRPAVVATVRFASSFDADEVRRRYPERMPQFQALPGLIQKYYLRDPATGEWAGLYLWDSRESLETYLDSELRRTIGEAYGVVGAPRVEVYEVEDVLRAAR